MKRANAAATRRPDTSLGARAVAEPSPQRWSLNHASAQIGGTLYEDEYVVEADRLTPGLGRSIMGGQIDDPRFLLLLPDTYLREVAALGLDLASNIVTQVAGTASLGPEDSDEVGFVHSSVWTETSDWGRRRRVRTLDTFLSGIPKCGVLILGSYSARPAILQSGLDGFRRDLPLVVFRGPLTDHDLSGLLLVLQKAGDYQWAAIHGASPAWNGSGESVAVAAAPAWRARLAETPARLNALSES